MKIKNKIYKAVSGLLLTAMVLGTAGCAAAQTTASPTATTVSAQATQVVMNNAAEETRKAPQPQPASNLSQQEIDDLLHMREEEKLARDVYLTLYDKWGSRVFENIASAEQTHTDAVKALLDKYGLEDPVAKTGDERGKFENPDLEELYNKLVEQGSKSLVDALTVGATIEDLDIKDLEDALSRTNHEDIKDVYENLKSGSENHMRAFVSNLEREGASYTPQFISQEEFNEIISGSNGGNGAGMRRGGGHGRRNG